VAATLFDAAVLTALEDNESVELVAATLAAAVPAGAVVAAAALVKARRGAGGTRCARTRAARCQEQRRHATSCCFQHAATAQVRREGLHDTVIEAIPERHVPQMVHRILGRDRDAHARPQRPEDTGPRVRFRSLEVSGCCAEAACR